MTFLAKTQRKVVATLNLSKIYILFPKLSFNYSEREFILFFYLYLQLTVEDPGSG